MCKTSTYLTKLLIVGLSIGLFVGCDDDDKKSTTTEDATQESVTSNEPAADESSASDDSSDSDSSDTAARTVSTGSRKILAFGDSITEGVGTSDPYPSKLARITGDQVINAGVTSNNSAQGARRIGGLLSKHKPTHVCILYGTNDVRTGISANATGSNISAMVSAVRASGAKAIVGTLPPLLERAGSLKSAVDATNGRIRSISGASIANVAGGFGSGEGKINGDGIHPNNSGAAVIAVAFSNKL